MINWRRAKHYSPPTNYPCLMLLESGESVIGIFESSMRVTAWTAVNLPAWMMRKTGDGAGRVYGENHHKATLSDADCAMIRQAYDTGAFSYHTLAEKFECSKSAIRDIIKERTRFSERQPCG